MDPNTPNTSEPVYQTQPIYDENSSMKEPLIPSSINLPPTGIDPSLIPQQNYQQQTVQTQPQQVNYVSTQVSPNQFSRPIASQEAVGSKYIKVKDDGNKVLFTQSGLLLIISFSIMILSSFVISAVLLTVFLILRFQVYFFTGPFITLIVGIVMTLVFGIFIGNAKVVFDDKTKTMEVKKNNLYTCFCLGKTKKIPYSSINYFDITASGVKINGMYTYNVRAYLKDGSSVKLTSYCFYTKASSICAAIKVILANGINSQI